MSSDHRKRYPAYKDSRVEWLGEVPVGWEVYAGKRFFANRRSPVLISDEQLAVTQSDGVIPQSEYMIKSGNRVVLALKGIDSFRHVESGDFVISLRSFQGGIEFSKFDGCVSPAYTVLAPIKRLSAGYYRLLFKSRPYIQAIQASTDSLREGKSITYEQFGPIGLPLPPLPEQEKIAAFLDYETERIDRLIEKQNRLIELLKEKRQALISHAVTKGLDPNAPMKDSGIEWLGEIPRHWRVGAIKYLAKVGNGSTPNRDNSEFWNPTEIPWLNSGKVNDGNIQCAEQFVSKTAVRQCHLPIVSPGSLLMAITGEGKTRGTVAKLDIAATISQHLAYIEIQKNTVSSQYLLHFLRRCYERLRLDSSGGGSTKAAITCEYIREIPVPLPPLTEQQAIVTYLGKQTDRFDRAVDAAERAIALLRERRTALISAAVTGKNDVRDWEPAAKIAWDHEAGSYMIAAEKEGRYGSPSS